jgi:hypothetical protein
MYDLAFSHDGKHIATVAHNDQRLKIWSLHNSPEHPVVYNMHDHGLKKFSIIT